MPRLDLSRSAEERWVNSNLSKKHFGLIKQNSRASLVYCLGIRLNRDALDLLKIPGGMGQWVMEEGCKAVDESGLMVQNSVKGYTPSSVKASVARERSSSKAQGCMAIGVENLDGRAAQGRLFLTLNL